MGRYPYAFNAIAMYMIYDTIIYSQVLGRLSITYEFPYGEVSSI